MIYDLIIIGAGPAGMTAGIYAARKKLKTLILTRDIGGQTAWSSDVENYPGFTMLKGSELVEKFEEHLEKFKDQVELRLTTQGVTKLEVKGDDFVVTMGDDKSEIGHAIIIAGGKIPRHLNVPGEKEFLNRGVTYCAWCDGPLFEGKDIAIIGGGNSALDAALSVAKLVKNIYIVNNTSGLMADQVMIDKVNELDHVRVMNNSEIKAIAGDKFVRKITIADKDLGMDKDLAVEGVFIEIGSSPATKYLHDLVKLDGHGEIIVDKSNMTSVPGIFAAGDITNVIEKQIVIAAGDGAKAAIAASQYLAKKPTKK